MGIAAYNRGSVVISRQIQEGFNRPRVFEIMDLLDAIEGQTEIFGPTIVRYDNGLANSKSKGWYILNRPGGWDQFAYGPFKRLSDIGKRFNLYWVSQKRDEFGLYWEVVPKNGYVIHKGKAK